MRRKRRQRTGASSSANSFRDPFFEIVFVVGVVHMWTLSCLNKFHFLGGIGDTKLERIIYICMYVCCV